MAHPRPEGPPDALSTMLRSATTAVHQQAEQRPFMQAFFAGQLPRDAYVAWLGLQLHLYRTIEARLDALPADAPERGLVPVELHRTRRIETDLDHLIGPNWRDHTRPTPATAAYVERIESTDQFAPGLIAHAWLRYMGNVGGRDTLRRITAASIGKPDGDDRGLAFTDFSAVGEIRPFFQQFHAKLDDLPLSVSGKAAAVAEADAGFRCNIALTDELAQEFDVRPPSEQGSKTRAPGG